ncbi:MAG: HAD family phosphatase [Deltaproteobacteria bacterium]|nr:MAG: HAD family phosphatase [Deltaproteobacteria bacterium]
MHTGRSPFPVVMSSAECYPFGEMARSAGKKHAPAAGRASGSAPVEVVLFDVGGVLAQEAIEWKAFDLAARYGIDPQHLVESGRRLRRRADLGLISEQQYWKRLLEKFGIEARQSDLSIERYVASVPGTLRILAKLSEGARCAILSNDSVELAEARMRKLGYRKLAERVFVSAEMGMVKPQPEIYLAAARTLGCEPRACLMVDDREINLAGARKAGMKVLLFRHSRQLEAGLRCHGLL